MEIPLIKINRMPIIEELILQTPGVFNYSPSADIEIAPKAFTPIYINLEIFTYYPSIRKYIINQLAKTIPRHTDVICGIESGGSYFASAVADQLGKPLILLRKENKTNNELSRIVGKIPTPNQSICLVDDVFSTGTTVYRAWQYLSPFKVKLNVRSVFSFGFEKDIGHKIGIQVESVSDISHVLRLALSRRLISPNDLVAIQKYIGTFKNYLETKKIIY